MIDCFLLVCCVLMLLFLGVIAFVMVWTGLYGVKPFRKTGSDSTYEKIPASDSRLTFYGLPFDKSKHWHGKVLHGGSSSTHSVVVLLPTGYMVDALCQSPTQWGTVHKGDTVFGGIHSESGKCVVYGKR